MKAAVCYCTDENFGDALNRDFFKFLGYEVIDTESHNAEVSGIGSILSWKVQAANFRGIVLGSGIIDSDHSFLSPLAESVLLVRGPKTAARMLQRPEFGYADPGIIVSEIFPAQSSPKRDVLIMPHYADAKDDRWTALAKALNTECFSVERRPIDVARAIYSCRLLVTSSLHGIIAADSYGIPVIWVSSGNLWGGRFKFDDYHEGLGVHRFPIPVTSVERYVETRMFRPVDERAVYESMQRVHHAVEVFRRKLVKLKIKRRIGRFMSLLTRP